MIAIIGVGLLSAAGQGHLYQIVVLIFVGGRLLLQIRYTDNIAIPFSGDMMTRITYRLKHKS